MHVLHIGLPKTGTTTLPHRVFGPARGVKLLHKDGGRAELELTVRLRRHARAPAAVALLQQRTLADAINALAAADRSTVLSEETVSFSQIGFWSGRAAAPERVAARLAGLAARLRPDLLPLRVRIGVRRQDRRLASCYAHASAHNPSFN